MSLMEPWGGLVGLVFFVSRDWVCQFLAAEVLKPHFLRCKRTLPRCETLRTGFGPFANILVLFCGDDGRGEEKEAQRQTGCGWVVMWVGVDASLGLVLGLGVGAGCGCRLFLNAFFLWTSTF